jgi:serine/threonine protein kinase
MIPFEETEISNTFLPLLECLQFLHKKGIVHGGVVPRNIIFTEEEEVKMKDWMADVKENIYYPNKKRKECTPEDDLAALGQIIAQASSLRKTSKVFQEKDLNSLLETLVDKYSKGFIFALAVLLKKNKERFSLLHHYFNNEEKYLTDLELNSLYETIKKEREKKKQVIITNENAIPNTVIVKGMSSLTESPVKKSTPNSSLNNTIKRTKDDENKKVHNDETKKKQIEKINKIIERSNEFVNELMARKNNEHILKKIAPKPNIAANISMYGDTAKKTVKEISIQISPTKRIRASSKKK